MTLRMQKINDNIRDEASKVLLAELRGGGDALVTVTRAEASPTLEHATIYLSIMPATQTRAVFGKVKHQIYFLQQALNRRLSLRVVPKIKFELDHSAEHIARIDAILQKAVK